MLQQDAYGYRLPYPVRYPVELHVPPGFKADDPGTWPRVDGRLEFVGGRLLYMPPSGDLQQDVATDVVFVLKEWSRSHPGYVVGGNEAGMVMGDETRAADVAVWRKSEVGPHTGGYRKAAPVLVVEIAGQDEGEPELRAKTQWYLQHGVKIVWLLFPQAREVLVLTSSDEHRYAYGDRLAEHPALPDLAPDVKTFFTQLD